MRWTGSCRGPILVALVSPYLPEGKRGRPPFLPKTMLRIHYMR
jgi:transposase, IS5 family